uniref:Coiled-coil-helix-coiled-coil-helix domain containing 7 n=1 Tax=Mus musculus TaxID=10090 RepID=D6REE9_MOUSE
MPMVTRRLRDPDINPCLSGKTASEVFVFGSLIDHILHFK